MNVLRLLRRTTSPVHRFVAFRYVSNTRGTWSVVLGAIVAVAALVGLLLEVAGVVCFDVGLHGSLTRKVSLAVPASQVLCLGSALLGLLVAYVLLRFSRLPRWLAAGAGGLIIAGAAIDLLKPVPAWRTLIAVGGAGGSPWTIAACAATAVGMLVILAGLMRRSAPASSPAGRLAAAGPGGAGLELGPVTHQAVARLSLLRGMADGVSRGTFVAGATRVFALLATLGLVAAQVLEVLLERTDAATPGFAALAAARAMTLSIVAACAAVVTIWIVTFEWKQRHVGAALGILLVGATAGAALLTWTAMGRGLPYADIFAAKATGLRFFAEAPTVDLASLASLGATAAIALVIAAFLAVLLLVSRFMSFYSTVSIGGVWIGTMALVVVLSVMGGFESDLRQKILGSNAHIQITREHGEFVDWRAVRARIDAVRGVQASTPFATSEVVIASNNNYFNVIIKGIDTTSVAAVTDLVRDLDDPAAMQRLEPIERDVIDLDADAEPIDFSGGGGGDIAPAPDARPVDAAPPAPSQAADVNRVGEGPMALPDLPPLGPPAGKPPKTAAARRVLTLNGVLVGRELTRQIHLSSGQEVRLISPLSDPSNPDATGTPIPFNRDYRVAGVFYTGMYEYDLKYVYVTLTSLQSFLDRGDAIDGIEVRVADPDGTGPVVAALSRELGPDYRVQDWRELNRNLFSALKLEKIAMFMVLAIIILVASFSIVGNLIMVVIEKGREIALLKTLGASTRDVVVIFVLQGVTIGFFGTALGLLSGLGICWYLAGFGFPINPDVYYISELPVHVDYGSVAMVGGAALVISVAATLYPAVLASRLRPAAGLRS